MPDSTTIQIIVEYALIAGLLGGGTFLGFLKNRQKTKYEHELAMEKERTKRAELVAKGDQKNHHAPIKQEHPAQYREYPQGYQMMQEEGE